MSDTQNDTVNYLDRTVMLWTDQPLPHRVVARFAGSLDRVSFLGLFEGASARTDTSIMPEDFITTTGLLR